MYVLPIKRKKMKLIQPACGYFAPVGERVRWLLKAVIVQVVWEIQDWPATTRMMDSCYFPIVSCGHVANRILLNTYIRDIILK